MINLIHSLLRRPEKGWDPVSERHAERYARDAWSTEINHSLIDELEVWVGGLEGKRVLDLGGGAGQYSVAFAKRGAQVTWHDISAFYRNFTEIKAREENVHIMFSLGYMEDAPEMLEIPFDLVFSRICWYYCRSDRAFSRTMFSLIKPGGIGYIDTTHSDWNRELLSGSMRIRTWLNDMLAFKIGHPLPPHGRLARLFGEMSIETLLADYSCPTNDRILFRRTRDIQ
jgi:2-polyprenyl-3-methyl-5-hydroxy-6-metoxy-1,4-benzoquinol methylase